MTGQEYTVWGLRAQHRHEATEGRDTGGERHMIKSKNNK